MLGTVARLALLRFMPRRLIPLLAAWQAVAYLRAWRRRQRSGAARFRGGTPATRHGR